MICADHIFRAYDIRGKAFVDFDEDGFATIAHAFGHYIRDKFKIQTPKVFVSGDGRQSMPELMPALITGLEAAGCEVIQGGTIPTPVNYFAFYEGGFDAAIQLSASHNPAQDNGLKLTDKQGAVCGNEIQKSKPWFKIKKIYLLVQWGRVWKGVRSKTMYLITKLKCNL